MWLPVDPVSEHTCLRLLKGSHKFPQYFKPVHFDGPPFTSYEMKPGNEKQADEFLSPPDVDGNDQCQVLSWNMEVGDPLDNPLRTPPLTIILLTPDLTVGLRHPPFDQLEPVVQISCETIKLTNQIALKAFLLR